MSQQIERHHQFWDTRPIYSFEYKGYKVCISEGGPKYEYTSEVTKEDCPHGFYDLIFTVEMGEKALFEMPIYIDALHDLEQNWSESQRKDARKNAAIVAARIHIDDLEQEYARH